MNNINGFKNHQESFGQSLAGRLRQVRIDRFGNGDAGLLAMASALGLPVATWQNYEIGILIPAEIMLKLIELTQVAPHWLLTGLGDPYYGPDYGSPLFLGL